MKNLIFIGGTMGVGKTTVGKILKEQLDNCVFLDADNLWDASPFIVTDETKEMIVDNISYILNSFLTSTAYKNIVFVWVMHEQYIIDDIISRLKNKDYAFYNFSLIASPESISKRLFCDIQSGIRKSDVIERSLKKIPLYDKVNSIKINTDGISAADAAGKIYTTIGEQND